MKVERRSQYVIAGTAYSREEVIHRYIHLVKYVAGRISVNLPPNVELNDLINDGVVGLIDAIEKYDDDRGVKFETYAITRIHGAILDALRSLDWVPRAVRQKAREHERAMHALETELGRQPTDDELAERMGSRAPSSTRCTSASAEPRCFRSRSICRATAAGTSR